MATKKTTKKSPSAKKATTSRKKTVVRKNSGSTSQIGLQAETAPFMTFKVTNQTLYWLVLGAVVIAFTAWLMHLQSSIQTLYDQIDATNATSLQVPVTKQK